MENAVRTASTVSVIASRAISSLEAVRSFGVVDQSNVGCDFSDRITTIGSHRRTQCPSQNENTARRRDSMRRRRKLNIERPVFRSACYVVVALYITPADA